MKIVIGADHGGFELKSRLIADLKAYGQIPLDLGVHDLHSADYPDFAVAASRSVMEGMAERGVLICTTGIGMSISANRFPGIRAALCASTSAAEKARSHNDANMLVLPGSLDAALAREILAVWLHTAFTGAPRHARRLEKIEAQSAPSVAMAPVLDTDPETWRILRDHARQENETLNLIASENNVSPAVRAAQGSVLTNKYAEGYPHKRWYNGCRFADEVETLALERAGTLFGADHANVQPHCGSSANMAVYFSTLQPGDTILAMSLAHGGHLTHGSPVNFSGRLFNIVSYGVRPEDETLDYEALEALAIENRPALIVAGASAYPRMIDFRRFREIADKVGARLMVDMAHIAGLVAGGAHPSPVPFADYVTTTTHKTLRGPRSGMVLCREAFARSIDKTIFPGLQGGPQVHVTAAKAVCFHEALLPAFKKYAAAIVENAASLAEGIAEGGFRLVSGGTDNHLMLVDLTDKGLTGRDAANALESIGIICNKNAIPFDRQSPFVTSGIRLGTPSLTTRGMGKTEMQRLADWIAAVLSDPGNESRLAALRAKVTELCREFPVP